MKGQIFLGAGEKSEAECYRLHKELDEALVALCGMQQLGLDILNAPEKIKEEYESSEVNIEIAARNIYQRLTGKKIIKTVDTREERKCQKKAKKKPKKRLRA